MYFDVPSYCTLNISFCCFAFFLLPWELFSETEELYLCFNQRDQGFNFLPKSADAMVLLGLAFDRNFFRNICIKYIYQTSSGIVLPFTIVGSWCFCKVCLFNPGQWYSYFCSYKFHSFISLQEEKAIESLNLLIDPIYPLIKSQNWEKLTDINLKVEF